MTDLEDRLRDELSQLAALAQPETIRPLRHLASRRRAAAARFLAPAAAMVAVAAVAIAGAVIARALPHRGAAPVPAAPELVRSGTVPRFYVLAYQSFVGGKIVTYAAVHSSATGATLSRVVLPSLFSGPSRPEHHGGRQRPDLRGDRDEYDQRAEHRLAAPVAGQRQRAVHQGHQAAGTRAATMAVDDVALSPDGTRVAMTAQWDCGHETLPARRDPRGRPGHRRRHGLVHPRQWRAIQRFLGRQPCCGLRMAAGPHTARQRPIACCPCRAPPPPTCCSQASPSPRRQPSRTPTFPVPWSPRTARPSSPPRWSQSRTCCSAAPWPRIVELNARTGHLERTLYTVSTQDQSDILDQECNVLSLGPGGQHPLVDCFSRLGALIDGQIVSLPGFPSPSSSGISGQQAIAW